MTRYRSIGGFVVVGVLAMGTASSAQVSPDIPDRSGSHAHIGVGQTAGHRSTHVPPAADSAVARMSSCGNMDLGY